MRLHLDLACVKLNETQVQLTKTQEEFKEAKRKLELKYDVVEKIVQCSEEHNYFKWKISGFSESLRKAKLFEKKNVINSEPFYRYGYKCRLYLAPNGEGSAENTHLSVFFRIMKGEAKAFHCGRHYNFSSASLSATIAANTLQQKQLIKK